MRELLAYILFISIFLFDIGYYLYCFKKGKYEAIRVWRRGLKETTISGIIVICFVVSMMILKPINISNYVIVIVVGIYLLVLNILNILIFKKTKKNKFGELILYDIFMTILFYFILK